MSNIRERKHRLPREAYRGRVTVSITACIDKRQSPFVEQAIVKAFVEKMAEAATKFGCQVPIYCFMPDHLHLILQGTNDSADVWRAVVDFKQKTGFWFGQQRPEFSWQKDFHDHVIRADEDLGVHIRYIANNPVRWGLVQKWQDHPYTGAIGIALSTVIADATSL